MLIVKDIAHAIDGALGTTPKLHAGLMIRQEASLQAQWYALPLLASVPCVDDSAGREVGVAWK